MLKDRDDYAVDADAGFCRAWGISERKVRQHNTAPFARLGSSHAFTNFVYLPAGQ